MRSAREQFADRLVELFKAAGNPTLSQVVSATEARTRATRRDGAQGRVPLQRICDWRSGRNVPGKFEAFEPVLLTLLSMVDTSTPLRAVLRDRSAWHRLWRAARAEGSIPVAAKPAPTRDIAEYPRPRVVSSLWRDLPTFVGRDAEVRRIVEAADSGRIVSVHAIDGMAGVGKTALVTRAAHLLADQFPDGRYFVELNAHAPDLTPADPFDVLATLLTDIGIDPGHIPATLDGRRDLWRDRVNGRRVLLVLDDALDRAQVEPLLPGGSGCLTLITGRRRLADLDGAILLELATLDPAGAMDLFCRVGRLSPTDADRAAVAKIVRLCGNLPLAIVLLAARLVHHPTWTVTGFADELATTHDRLAELEAGQRAVRAAFMTSYLCLPPDRRQLFRRLGLHPGPEIDAHAAAALDAIPVAEARRGLEALYLDHLIEETAPGRYRAHDLVREFSGSLAAQDPADDRDRALDRLLEYYAHAAHSALYSGSAAHPEPSGNGPVVPVHSTQAEALAWMGRERPNILACLEYSASRNQVRHVVALTAALTVEVRLHGPWQLGIFAQRDRIAIHTVAEALAFKDFSPAGYLPDGHAVAAGLLRRQLDRDPDMAPPMRIAALRTLVFAYLIAGEDSAAMATQQQILTWYRDTGDRAREGAALSILGWIHHVVGEELTAIDLQCQALVIHQLHGNDRGEADTRANLAWAYCTQGDWATAADQIRRARVYYNSCGRRSDEAFALGAEGWAAFLAGHWSRAKTFGLRAQRIWEELGNRSGEAFSRNNVGRIDLLTGDYSAALAEFQQALVLHEGIGNGSGIPSALNNLGIAHAYLGDYSAAESSIRRALAIYAEIGNNTGRAEAIGHLGWVQHMRGHRHAAIDLLHDALTIFQSIHSGPGETETRNRIGAVAAEIGDWEQALSIYEVALGSARRIRSRIEEARALEGIARCCARYGHESAAETLLGQAMDIYTELGAAEALNRPAPLQMQLS